MNDSPFERINSLKAQKTLDFNSAHKEADTDAERTSIHHTLGVGANQAAPGNHMHYLPDTNWASISGKNGWTGEVWYIRRSGIITVECQANKAAWGVNDVIIDTSPPIPVGFRPHGLVLFYGGNAMVNNDHRSWWIGSDGVVRAATGGTGSIYGAATFVPG